MKNLTMCYFMSLAGLNTVFALCLPPLTAYFEVYAKSIFDTALPSGTIWAYQYSWWPWVGAAICVAGAVLSQRGKVKDKALRTFLIIILFVELGIMFFSVVSFTTLFCIPSTAIGEQ